MRGSLTTRAKPRTLRPAPLGVMTLLSIAMLAVASPVLAASGPANSSATISGSFQDGCRDFAAASTKDISHVYLSYADGRAIKYETINDPAYRVDGEAGDELDAVIVKSGTNSQAFSCSRNRPPTAVLELETPPLSSCTWFPWPEYPTCLAADQRSTWSVPPGGVIAFLFEQPFPPATFRFRGTTSNDPDEDLVGWSIDFGDGTTTGGSWATNPPSAVPHTFSAIFDTRGTTVTLTVTDATGNTSASSMTLLGIDISPD